MPPTTVQPKVSLNSQQRTWLEEMAEALQVKLGGTARQTGDPGASPTEPSTRVARDSKSSTVTGAIPTRAAKTGPPPSDSAPAHEKKPTKTPAKSPQEEAYAKELAELLKLVGALAKHPHKAHIQAELTSLTSERAKADIAFKKKKYADAMKSLAKAKDMAVKAKGFADGFEAYAKKRAEAQFLVRAFKDVFTEGDNKTYLDNRIKAIADADKLAKPPTRNYAAATAKVESASKDLKDTVTRWYVTNLDPKIQALKTGATNAFLAEQIKEIEAEDKTLKSYIAAQDWRKALLQGPKVRDMVDGSTEASSRRDDFDSQRVDTVAAIDGLKPFKEISTQMNGLNKRLAAADDQASIKNRQFENGVDALKKIEEDAKRLAKYGPDTDSYAKDRQVADTAYQKLATNKQAAAQKPLLDAIKIKMDKAAELANWFTKIAEAIAVLKLAQQDIDAAAKVLGEVDAVNTAAGNASDAATAKKSLDALKTSLDAAKKHKRAADFDKEFKALDEKVVSAEAKLKDANTATDAIDEIKAIGADLSKVLIQLTQQDGYAADRAALGTRLKNVKALPEAKTIQASITPIEVALKDADAQDKAHSFDKRARAMEKARAAADLAEKTADESKTYQARQKKLETAVAGSSLSGADKKQVTDAIKLAAHEATALKYNDATKLLVKAETTYESLLINGYAKQDPPDLTKIKAAADRMMKSGSAKEIDKLIQKLPDSTKHSVLKTLAKERFGIKLKTDSGTATKTAKAMLNMMAKVPDDVRNNPSLKTVERRTPDENGGWYEPGTKAVVMKGRPGQATQEFGKGIASELPSDVEPNCKPKNEKAVDFLDFATLHELGHSVDDNLQFMASREGKRDFANWRTIGGNIDAMVDAVAKWTKYDSTPEQKKAISDLIQGNQVTWPTAPAGKEDEWKTAKDKAVKWHARATKEGVWEKESETSKINVDGTVFHLAYPRTWVSYDYAARKKGVTGYQFRAPGEWFAELYASYRMDKLQSSHPAVGWLSKLKV